MRTAWRPPHHDRPPARSCRAPRSDQASGQTGPSREPRPVPAMNRASAHPSGQDARCRTARRGADARRQVKPGGSPGCSSTASAGVSAGWPPRLPDFWLPAQTVLYVGMTQVSVSRRVGARTAGRRSATGSRTPAATGSDPSARVRPGPGVVGRDDRGRGIRGRRAVRVRGRVDTSPRPRHASAARVILPSATLQTATAARKAHGITGAIEPAPPVVPVPGTTVVEVPAEPCRRGWRSRPECDPSSAAQPARAAPDRDPKSGPPTGGIGRHHRPVGSHCADRRRARTSAPSTTRSRRSPAGGSSASSQWPKPPPSSSRSGSCAPRGPSPSRSCASSSRRG